MRRVYINGDLERLPKEKGEYMICNRQSFYMQTKFNPKLQESKRVWLKEVTWYELPVPRSEIIEILRGLKNYMVDIAHGDDDACYVISEKGFEIIADEIIGGK